MAIVSPLGPAADQLDWIEHLLQIGIEFIEWL